MAGFVDFFIIIIIIILLYKYNKIIKGVTFLGVALSVLEHEIAVLKIKLKNIYICFYIN